MERAEFQACLALVRYFYLGKQRGEGREEEKGERKEGRRRQERIIPNPYHLFQSKDSSRQKCHPPPPTLILAPSSPPSPRYYQTSTTELQNTRWFTPVSIFLRPLPNLSMTTNSQLHVLDVVDDQTLNCNLITEKILKSNSSSRPKEHHMFAAGHKTWYRAPTISCPSLSTIFMPRTCCHFMLNPATPS